MYRNHDVSWDRNMVIFRRCYQLDFTFQTQCLQKREKRNSRDVLIAMQCLWYSVLFTEEPYLAVPDCEIIWAKIKMRGRLICSYYRPDVSNEVNMRNMADSLRLACYSQKSIIIPLGNYFF